MATLMAHQKVPAVGMPADSNALTALLPDTDGLLMVNVAVADNVESSDVRIAPVRVAADTLTAAPSSSVSNHVLERGSPS